MRLRPRIFVSDHSNLLLLFYTLGKTFGQPPSAWIMPQRSSPADYLLAIDFDVACLLIGKDAEAIMADQLRNK